MAKNKEPSQRQLRVGEEIRHVLSNVFMRGDFLHNDLQNVSITVSEVDVSPDLRNATAYISPLGRSNDADTIVAALNMEAPLLNKEVARRMAIKFTPRLRFAIDGRFDYAEKIENLIRQVNTPDNA